MSPNINDLEILENLQIPEGAPRMRKTKQNIPIVYQGIYRVIGKADVPFLPSHSRNKSGEPTVVRDCLRAPPSAF